MYNDEEFGFRKMNKKIELKEGKPKKGAIKGSELKMKILSIQSLRNIKTQKVKNER
ncbi:hypothetical protein RSJ42_00645 [Methanosarcina hadiensis]|uniref:hypothetical protein n=1 Tax=Methanosarcina hadiensis TaxID=3078083 RepID=UPI00397791EF